MRTWSAPFHYCRIEGGVFSAAECADIIAISGDYPGASGFLPDARECNLFWLNYDVSTSWIFERVARLAETCNEYYGFDLNPHQTSGLQISRYRPGERYDWHMDVGDGVMSLRKLSIVVELSDPSANGGRFEVFYGERDNRIPLRAGDAAVFPSWVMHRAVTPETGERWTLAAWICGAEPFR